MEFESIQKFNNLVEVFENQVRLHPDKIALKFKDIELSYSELNGYANGVARRLIELGVQIEDKIPLLVERSERIIIGMLGILKAGAAFVPLSSEFPAERNDYIIEQTGAKFCVNDNFMNSELSFVKENVRVPIKSDTLAYIIFTSGTTGKPKGVMIEHASVLNLAAAHAGMLGLSGGGHTYLQYANYIFDASILEIFPALLYGNQLTIVPEEIRLDLKKLSLFIEENNVDCAFIPPILLDTETILPVKTLIVGGEKTSEKVIMAYLSRGIEIVNAYGPTELTVSCTLHKFKYGDLANIIGPLQPNMVGYVVNENMELVKDGEVGEFVVGGIQLSRGYLNAPKLTEEKFIANPFGLGKVYKTGDLVSKLSDGSFEYHGRDDSQVKIHGQRVELGEVESALMSVQDILQVCVITYKDSIIAYYASRNTKYKPTFLRNKLKKILPDYMVPVKLIDVPSFPMTINGKIDKGKLPDPMTGKNEEDDNYVAPQTKRQEQVQAIIEQVVGFSRVSIDANIFEIGGNSITAIQIANRMRISVSDVYNYKTIRRLAETVPETEKIQRINFTNEKEQLLSYGQESMWFIQELNQKTIAYNNVVSIALNKKVKASLIEEGLKNIIQRHEVLRTTIKDGFQHVVNNNLEISHEPISAEEFGRRPFNLSFELPIRANFFGNRLILSIHHIAFDGWSLDILLTELADFYQGKELADLPFQYKDFAAWQRKNHNQNYFSKSLDYWKNELKDFEQLDLPTDYTRPTQFDYIGDEQTFEVSPLIYKNLEMLARKNSTTIYTVFLAAFYILLSSYSNQDDITIGSPFANRQFPGCEKLIGFFANTLPMRARLGHNQSFKELIMQTHDKISRVQEYQEIPLEKIVTALNLERDPSRNPLFQVVFTFQEFGTSLSPNLFEEVNPEVNTHSSQFDLSLNICDHFARITYSKSIFKADTIKSFIETFILILEQVSQDETIKLKDIVLTQVQLEFEKKQLEYTDLVKAFEAQVEKTPNQVALSYKEQIFSYTELNQEANAFAYALVHEYGVKQGDILPILLPRSEKVIITILAIMKAGAAYIPLSIEYPQERIDYILRMVEAPFIIDEKFVANINSENKDNLDLAIKGSDLAYLIFTSGSTGKPKGVMIEHASVLNLAAAHAGMLGLSGGGHTYLQYANYIFDASILEIFPALLYGNQLTIVPEEIRLDLKKLSLFIEENNVDCAFIPPILLDTETILPVKTLIVGGDKTAIEVVNTYLDNGIDVYNAYGPTESTVSATIHKYEKGDNAETIGKGQLNTPVYIFDKFGREVPSGAIGELFVGGPQLSRGYIKQEELTRERFIDSSKGRLYATGDLVRLQSDGNLKYLGRNDFQVKIRGNRIELGEIEKTLANLPEISQVLVLAKNNSLIAYYVTDHSFTVQELSQYLSKFLAPYMIPSYFVQLDKFPMHINGKIDLSALPKPTISLNDKEFIEVETELENEIKIAFATVLSQDLSKVSATANFFHIGGDSIKAILITSILKKRGIVTNVRQIMEHPTIQQLAKVIESDKVDSQIDTSVEDGKVFKSPIQNWFLNKGFENPNHFNQAYLLKTEKYYDEKLLQQAVQRLINHHDALRSRVNKENQELIQDQISDYQFEDRVMIDTTDISEESNWEISLENIEKLSQKNFDIYRGRLMSLQQIISPNETFLLISIHHLVIDEVSWHIFLEDLFTLLDNFDDGKVVELPEKTSSAENWAKALTKHSQRNTEEIDYWTKLAQEENDFLPKDFVTQASYFSNNKKIIVSLTPAETEGIVKLAHKAYNTQINDLLLSSLALGLNRKFGTRNVFISLEGHGREQFDPRYSIERTVGWFTSLYPFYLKTEMSSLEELIIETKESLRAVPSKGLIYSLLKDNLGDQISISTPEISFNFIGDISENRQTNYHIVKELTEYISDPLNEKLAVIEINSYILRGQLFFEIDYSKNAFKEETIADFAQKLIDAVNDVSTHCQSLRRTVKTISDFGNQTLTNADLETIYEKVQNVEKIKPLSPMQLGIFYDYLKEPSSSRYTEQITALLDGPIEIEAIERAFEQLICYHDVLKSVFLFDGLSEPKQISSSTPNLSIGYYDLSALSEEDRQIKKFEIMKLEQTKGFNLENNLGIRLSTIKEGDNRTSLVFTFHHILMDGWSYALFLKKFFAYFKESKSNETGESDYFDYIDQLTTMDKKSSLDYWENYLASYDGDTQVPSFEKIHSFASEKQMRRLSYRISNTLMTKLRSLSNEKNVTLNDVCSALWGISLQKLNQTNDVVFGSILSGRNIDNFDASNILGLCIQQVPLRVQNQSQCESILDLVLKVKEDIKEAQDHLNCNLAEILSNSSISTLSHKILFDNYPLINQNLLDDNLKFRLADLKAEEIVEYDFGLSFLPGEEMKDSLEVEFNFDSQKYSEKDIDKIYSIFSKLLETFVEDPHTGVERFSILNNAEREKISSYSGVKMISRNNLSLLERFKESVTIYSDKVAIYAGNEQLTYQELDRLSNGIADHLKKLGVKSFDHVVLYLEADKFLLPSIWGVLKAGATFVPLDSESPKERNEHLMSNEQRAVVLINSDYPVGLFHLSQVVDVREIQALDKFDYSTEIDAPAYMIYTSGTTGSPKGVVISKVSLLNYIEGMLEKIGKEFLRNSILTSKYNFDLGYTALFIPLFNGGAVTIASKESYASSPQLAKLIQAHQITYLKMTPSLFSILQPDDFVEIDSLKAVLLGGESIQADDLLNFRKVNPRVEFWNHYGPTETTIGCISGKVDWKKLEAGKSYNILGKPNKNMGIYVLDKQHRMLPFGSIGELYVVGTGLAEGYFADEKLTAEKFISNPFDNQQILYATGDQVRLMENGDLIFCGRNDSQIKHLGYRINLTEIESNVVKEDSVVDATVIQMADDRIGAAVVLKNKADLTLVKHNLKNILPSYMYPNYIVQLEKFPLTSNGKKDLRQLKRLIQDYCLKIEEKSDIETETERRLHQIWSELLRINTISKYSNFYELGGNSLQALRLLSTIRSDFKKELSLSEIVNAGTIDSLAKLIDNRDNSYVVSIERAEVASYYVASSQQKQMYALSMRDPSCTAYNVPIMLKLKVDATLDIVKIKQALYAVVSKHEALRTLVFADGDFIKQKILEEFSIPFEVKHISEISARTIWTTFVKPFDLTKEIPIRVHVIYTRTATYLVIDSHHIVMDGCSIKIFLKDLMTAYHSKLSDEEVYQYKDFSEFQLKLDFKKQEKLNEFYWKRKLNMEIPILDLSDHRSNSEGGYSDFEGETLRFQIETNLANELVDVCKINHFTLNSYLLSLFALILSRFTNEKELIIGGVDEGRNYTEFDQTIGMFVNSLPHHLSLDDSLSFRQLLKATQAEVLQDVEHSSIPFERMVQLAKDNVLAGQNPLFDVSFVYSESVVLENSEFELCDPDYEISKFDLTLLINKSQGRFNGIFEFKKGKVSRGTVQTLKQLFEAALAFTVKNLDEKLQSVKVMSIEKERKLLAASRGAIDETFKNSTVLKAFEDLANATPNKICIEEKGKQFSYKVINELANALANYLKGRIPLSQTIVPIYMTRSKELIVSILALWKLGKAYLPLDSSYPSPRVQQILSEVKVTVILSQSFVASDLNKNEVKPILVDLLDLSPEKNGPIDGELDRLAYVIFTSGTTGRPKGIEVNHSALANYIHWAARQYILDGRGDFALFTSISFDLTVTALFVPISSGHKLIIFESDDSLGLLEDVVREDSVDIVKLTPAHLSLIVQSDFPLNNIHTFILGGENLNLDLTRKIHEKYPEIRIFNEYGPTEATVGCLIYQYKSDDTGVNVSIGRPIDNVEAYVLDNSQKLLPAGAVGELYIGGACLSNGYFNNPSLNQERFIVSPFEAGKYLYRTGDLCKWDSKMQLDCLGRKDEQVKVNGYRIELGDIEHKILSYPFVKQAVVFTENEEIPHTKLSAAIVSEDSQVDTEKLREFLTEQLPYYMIPTRIIQVEEIPLTVNGKKDLRLLSVLSKQYGKQEVIEELTTEKEMILAKLIQETLNVSGLNRMSNYYELGGDSIQAILISSRLKNEGFDLKTIDILQNPVLKNMASHVEYKEKEKQLPIPYGKQFNLTPIQQWLFNQKLSNIHHYNQSILVQFELKMTFEEFKESLWQLSNIFPILQTRFIQNEEGYSQSLLKPSKTEVERKIFEHEISQDTYYRDYINRTNEYTQATLNIYSGDLWRGHLFNTEEGQYCLLVVHHLVVDIVSWDYILTKLDQIVRALKEGRHLSETSYQGGFLEWQEALSQPAQSKMFTAELDYWKKHVANISPVFTPLEKVRMDLEKPQIERRTLSLFLKDFVQANHTYLTKSYELVLAGLIKGLSSYTDRPSLAVMLESHGRYDLENNSKFSQSVGWYTSLYPCDFSLENSKNNSCFIREVKEQYRDLPNLGIGYGLLKYNRKLLNEYLEPDIKINFLGDLGKETHKGQFSLENWLKDYDSSPFNRQNFALEITAYFFNGELHLIVKESQTFKNAEFADLVENLSQSLLEVIDCCKNSMPLLSPSDIGAKRIGLKDFDRIQQFHQDVVKVIDLTPLQKGLFYQWSKDPVSNQYIEQSVFEFSSPLNKFRLRKTVDCLVQRYDALRSTFMYEGLENVKQLIHKSSNLKIDDDLIANDESELQELISKDSNEQFDLIKGPLLRLKVVNVAQRKQVLIFTFHHLILDGWSKSLLVNEFIKLYQKGNFKDFANFEDKALETYAEFVTQKDKKESLNYWIKYLKDYDSVCRFPESTLTDESLTNELEYSFDEKTTQSLRKLSKECNVTFYTLLKAIWGLLLIPYTEGSDVVFGTIVSGRTKEIPNILSSIGMFINTIPVRVKLDVGMNFTNLVQTLNQESFESEANNFSSLAEIQDHIKCKTKLFNTLFVFENYPAEQTSCQLLSDEKTSSKTEFDLEALCSLSDKLHFKLRYQMDKIDGTSLNYLLESLKLLIDQVIEDPYRNLANLSTITPSEMQAITALNSSHGFYPSILMRQGQKGQNLIELIEENAKNFPERTAIYDYEKKYSYREFVDRANLLASKLYQSKLKSGDVIGLFMDKSADLVIAMYAVWKIGAVVLPIDITLPESRIDYMISNSATRVILTNFEADKLAFTDCLVVNTISDSKTEKEGKQIKYHYQPDRLAYILYTSGSTGLPKGVEVSQGALTNFIFNSLKAVSFPDKINMLATTSCSFDISISEMFWPLVVGGELTILSNIDSKNPEKICETINHKHCNAIQTTPSRVQLLLQYKPGHSAFRNLTHMYLMGEVLSDNLVSEVQKVSDSEIFNCYGPTESTIWVSAKKIEVGQKITIGKPIENVQFYILKKNLTVAPLGTYGQLAIAGDSLAIGYRNNGGLTSKSFVRLGAPINQRVYLTGDLARLNDKGEVEVVGRIDNQIKINGVRIELEEIEKVALKYRGINNAVAIANQEGSSKFISLYFTTDQTEEKLSTLEIRQYLSHQLLSQMLPKKIYQVDYFPLSTNGKVDNKKLLEMVKLDQTNRQLIKEEVKYHTNTQKQIAKIWEKELNQDNIGLFESYFDIGGNSLKIIQLLNALNNSLSISLTIADLFKYPSIALLSERVDKLLSHEYLDSKEVIKVNLTSDPVDATQQKAKIFVSYVLMISHLTKNSKVSITEYLTDTQYVNHNFDTDSWETIDTALEAMIVYLSTKTNLPSIDSASFWKYSLGNLMLDKAINGVVLKQDLGKLGLYFDSSQLEEKQANLIVKDLRQLLSQTSLRL
ncbi:amino acid adenylation domain-containing protein [Streptococcus mutans]|uniref:amino acid adenylation domain-containing protein n=1 Tax=Streptococcus mutans TaxID=1309 RepID=UPI0038B7DD7C